MLQLAAAGLADKEIAAALGIAYQTTRNCMNAIAGKYGTSGRTAAVIHGIVAGDVWLPLAIQMVEERRQE